MAIEERSRKRLHDALVRAVGEEEAAELMAHLPRVVESEVVTRTILKEELDRLEHKLLAEIHRVARSQLLAFTTIVGILNGVTFFALRAG